MGRKAALVAQAIREDERCRELVLRLLAPEVQSALSHLAAKMVTAAYELSRIWAPHLEKLIPIARKIGEVLSEPRAAEYEALLIGCGYEPSEARVLSIWAVTTAEQTAEDLDHYRRKLGSALGEVVRAVDQSTLVMSRRAQDLLPLVNDWSRAWIESGLAASGLSLSFEDFYGLVEEAAGRQPAACKRLGEVVARAVHHVPKAREIAFEDHRDARLAAHDGPQCRAKGGLHLLAFGRELRRPVDAGDAASVPAAGFQSN